jgi:hypothetical protein
MNHVSSMRSRAVSLAALGALALAPAATADLAPFTEEAADRGIVYETTQPLNRGQGVVFADLDDDGDPDLVAVGAGDGTVGVWENDGTGHFIDHSATSGIAPLIETSSVIAADYDRDGDLDIYIARYYMANVLLRNDGGFTFADVTDTAGVGDLGNAYGAAWGDYDNDGWPDLYVANRTTLPHDTIQNELYHNLGGGVFEPVGAKLGVDSFDDPTLQSAFLDFDRDGDHDLYLATDKGTGCETNGHFNHLFENQGDGTFIDITESSGTEACVDAMSIAIGDFDGNGEHDLYCTNTPGGHALMMNQGGAVFTREEEQWGVASYAIGWGAVFFDWDHDGHNDLYVCQMNEVNRFYRHEGTWPCAEIGGPMGVDTGGDSFCLATGDVDGDGDLDLVVQTTDRALELFMNQEGQKRNWVKFDVIGEGPNRYALGAQVSARCDGIWRVREIVAGCNYKSQNDLVVHFGVDQAETVDAVKAQWLGGNIRTLSNYPALETWTIYPWDKLGDADGDGDRDLDDFFVFASCLTGDAPGTISTGCEMMDYEGDADVDIDDFDLFLAEYDGVIEDCNGNKIPDLREIIDGSGSDLNGNGILDECEDVYGDLNGDTLVDVQDLLILLSEWGEPDSIADLNDDGTVDTADLVILLGEWS